METYIGIAETKDGAIISEVVCQTMYECSDWADDIRQNNDSDIIITIRRKGNG